jgi:saccharopine dehydrogenase-like NADP-dependent oxidoreductase
MGKKILVLGTGAQGSTVAQRMDEDPGVSEIVCADCDEKAVDALVRILTKGRGARVDAASPQSIMKAAQGVDLIVNALPLQFGKNVLETALAAGANYQDFAAPEYIAADWVLGIKVLFRDYSPRFKDIGRLAVVGTGSAPGLICAATRVAVRELDDCDTIYNIVWEGVEAKRFQPYWWSPVTALNDMREDAFAFENGEIVRTPPFSLPIYRQYSYMDKPVCFVEHAHDEPVYMGLNAKTHFKGVKNVYFKYGGSGVQFAEPLYKVGMLSREPETFNGCMIVPFDFVLSHVPPAPKYKEDIRAIIDEGLVSDSGCMVVEAYGRKDGRRVRVETHVFAPGLVDSFKRAGLTAEMYLTGQGGALFTEMFVNDKYEQTGLITTDMLTEPEIDHYFTRAAAFDITLKTEVFDI